jgi:hypothetical protein
MNSFTRSCVLVSSVATALIALPARAGEAAPGRFKLWSPAIPANGWIPERFSYDDAGCHGANVSPPLDWANVPHGTRSFVITVFDPDERITGSGWWHWVVYDIPAGAHSLPLGVGSRGGARLANGAIQAHNDLDVTAYTGPCPEAGETHRYVFTIYALKIPQLPVSPSATPAMIRYVLNDDILGVAAFAARSKQ